MHSRNTLTLPLLYLIGERNAMQIIILSGCQIT